KGELELVREPIIIWLEKNWDGDKANFVYKAWLDAGGDTEMVHKSIEVWLRKHGEDVEAEFVYSAWFKAGGASSVIKSSAIRWLHQNRDKASALYITKFLAMQDIPVDTVKDILIWCCEFPDNENALWRLTQLKVHLLNEEVGEEVITTSEAVLNPLILIQVPLTAVIRGQINTLFSYLISAPKLRSDQLRKRVDTLFLAWLRNPAAFENYSKPHINLQQSSYVQRVIDLIVSDALDINADYEPLERFLHWINSWEPERKSQLYRRFDFLKYNYPAPGLWDIVKIR
ncbi:MAG: hypothetical protein OIN90_04695, partial [Candidatus Methanoperedens sp.]|nr:hypothetical protein [Candidatus Methanoperedens sp.]